MRRLAFAAVLVLLAGCGSPKVEHTSSSAGTSAGIGAAGSSGTSGSGSTGTTGSAGSSTGSSGGHYAGLVSFSDFEFGAVGAQKSVNAVFGDASVAAQFNPADCRAGTVDANGCCVHVPATSGGSASGSTGTTGASGSTGSAGSSGSSGSTGTAPNAGVLALTASGTPFGSLTPDANSGLYPPLNNATWSPGQTLAVTAAGATVHAFSGSVVAPTPVTVTSPAVGTFPFPTVSTQSALQVTWQGGSAQTSGQSKTLVVVSNQDRSRSVVCYIDTPAAPRFTIAASSMGIFAGQPGGGVLVGVGVLSTTSSDNATVTLAALTAAGGGVQFQ